MFRPKGSSFVYEVQGGLASVPGYQVGDTLRICGYLDTTTPTFCMQGLAQIVVNSVSDCDTAMSRPDRLIAQWAFKNVDVFGEQVGTKVDCGDYRQIFSYTVDLPKGCLVHNFAGTDEIPDPNGPFFPRNGRTYWLSVQAEVGVDWVKTGPGVCSESKTGQTITQEFWGWHTTPPGYQHKDDAYMGQLEMGCPPDEWLYNWMGPLHCSDPQFTACCDDPTKSIDMAFCLLETLPGKCSGTNISCATAADCPVGSSCIPGSDFAWWCQPLNGGGGGSGDPPSVPRPFPVGNIDELTHTHALVAINIYNPPEQRDLTLTGSVVIARSGGPDQVNPQPEPPQPLPSMIETEMQIGRAHV
jgi:hypothetical protein